MVLISTATKGKTVKVIQLKYSTDSQVRTYGILYEGLRVHEVTGQSHNRHAPFRFKVWSNVNRPNKWPEGEWTDYGYRGGPGMYLDPKNKGTDSELSFTVGAEATVISAHGDGTGTEASGQMWGETLAVGDVVMLRTPEGAEYGPFVVTDERHNGLSLK